MFESLLKKHWHVYMVLSHSWHLYSFYHSVQKSLDIRVKTVTCVSSSLFILKLELISTVFVELLLNFRNCFPHILKLRKIPPPQAFFFLNTFSIKYFAIHICWRIFTKLEYCKNDYPSAEIITFLRRCAYIYKVMLTLKQVMGPFCCNFGLTVPLLLPRLIF